jgi:hypothetical protein
MPTKEEVQTKSLRPLLRLTIKDHQTKSNTRSKLKIGNMVEDMKALEKNWLDQLK